MLSSFVPFSGSNPHPAKRRRIVPIVPKDDGTNALFNSNTPSKAMPDDDISRLTRLQMPPDKTSVHKAATEPQQTVPKAKHSPTAKQGSATINTVIEGLRNLLNVNIRFQEDSNQTDPEQARLNAVLDLATQLDETAKRAEANLEDGTARQGKPSILAQPLKLSETSQQYLKEACILKPDGSISEIGRYVAERSIEEPEEIEDKNTGKKKRIININPPFASIPERDESSCRGMDEIEKKASLSKVELERPSLGYQTLGIEQLLDAAHPHPLEIKALEDLHKNLDNPSAIGQTSQAYLLQTCLLTPKGSVPKPVQMLFKTFKALEYLEHNNSEDEQTEDEQTTLEKLLKAYNNQDRRKTVLELYKALQDFGANWADPGHIQLESQLLLLALGFLKRDKITVPESVKRALDNGSLDHRLEHTAQALNVEFDRHAFDTALQELKTHTAKPSEISPDSLNLLLKLHCLQQQVSLAKAAQSVDPEKLRHRVAKDLLRHLKQGKPINPVSLDYLRYAGIFSLNKKAALFKAVRDGNGNDKFPLPTPELLAQRYLRDDCGNPLISKETRTMLLSALSIDSTNSNRVIYKHPKALRKSKRLFVQ